MNWVQHRLFIIVMTISSIGLLLALLYTSWYVNHLGDKKTQLFLEQLQAKELLQRVLHSEIQINHYKKILKDADKRGFFTPISIRKYSAKLKIMAEECGIQDTVINVNPLQQPAGQGRACSVSMVLRADWDQDVYQFLYRLENEGFGNVHIYEINIFRESLSEIPGDVVHAELKFNVMSY